MPDFQRKSDEQGKTIIKTTICSIMKVSVKT